MSIGKVKFSELQVRPEEYSFRRSLDADPFSEAALHSLKEQVKAAGGITVPLILKVLPGSTGKKLVTDGHRRFFVLKLLIEEQVDGFGVNMLVPAQILDSHTSELTMITTGLMANIEQSRYPSRVAWTPPSSSTSWECQSGRSPS